MKKYKIGYTTGVFDLFHIGHLNILQKAKEHCDYLIVAVTTDNEVIRIKKRKPIIQFEERLKIVESIKFVDIAVPEDDTNKVVAWEKYKFNVIFKGSDWKGTEKWNQYEKQFKEIGVDIIYFPYTQSTSSTKLREVLDNVLNVKGYCE